GSAEASVLPGGSAVTAGESKGALLPEEKSALERTRVRAGIRNRMAFNEGYGSKNPEPGSTAGAPVEKNLSRGLPQKNTSVSEKLVSKVEQPVSAPKIDKLPFKLEKGGSVEGTLNQYLKAHIQDIKTNPGLQKALGWDGDPKHIGRASHRLWLRMVDDVRAHPHAPGHQKLIEQLEKAGFHVKEVMKDTQHPERLTKMFDAAARRMPIGMEFTINPKTGALEFPDPRVGKLAGGIHEGADSTGKKMHHGPKGRVSSRLQEMLDEKHWQETDESMARLKQNIDELKQSTQDSIESADRASQEIALKAGAREEAIEMARQSAEALQRGDAQLQKIGLFAQERNAWLAD
ncbi:MAG: hypothetical protein AAB975_02370, partial [Patescibacteria group bacterium]